MTLRHNKGTRLRWRTFRVWQFETCWSTQELRMRIKYARKHSLFIMWLLYA